ncbi:hypothetical protein NPIL_301891 [Nephila pilipes]|uniref:Uncharacterized protein n=1 Tax=Nephila pilipes TaxID=299642 RepID=A0A8X6U266_NEPPI|nr:hypothetical protein NPIL_301891 [Nephila pilipes]
MEKSGEGCRKGWKIETDEIQIRTNGERVWSTREFPVSQHFRCQSFSSPLFADVSGFDRRECGRGDGREQWPKMCGRCRERCIFLDGEEQTKDADALRGSMDISAVPFEVCG